MEVVYRQGRATAAEIARGLLDPPSYSAVRAMLVILVNKGHLRHESEGQRYVYLPTVPRERARRRAMRELVTTFFGGSPKDAVVALLEETDQRLSAKDLEEIRRRIENAKRKGG